jgi:hypothetical protein
MADEASISERIVRGGAARLEAAAAGQLPRRTPLRKRWRAFCGDLPGTRPITLGD